MSKPNGQSEPQKVRTPQTLSEPKWCSKPEDQSEPSLKSKPDRFSEPKSMSKPNSISEPRGGSESKNISKPRAFSDLRMRIRRLVDIYYDVQDVRIRTFNRLRQLGEIEGVDPIALKKLERELNREVERWLKGIPIWEKFLKQVRGVGAILAGGIIGWFDPSKTKHVSGFWRYCGLHVVDGEAVRRMKGAKMDFNPKLRALMWKLTQSFIRNRNPDYFPIYEQAKLEENIKLKYPLEDPRNCPKYEECIKRLKGRAKRLGRKIKKPPCKLHIDLRARRKMAKQFLLDLWVTWRTLENLPVTPPYSQRKRATQ